MRISSFVFYAIAGGLVTGKFINQCPSIVFDKKDYTYADENLWARHFLLIDWGLFIEITQKKVPEETFSYLISK